MMRLREAFEDADVEFVGVKEMYRNDVAPHAFHVVPDVSRLHKHRVFIVITRLLCILIKVRPDVIITTGSAPGMLALRLGKLFGARTVWIDSLANVEQLSTSGMKARKYADLWLTQWPHLETNDGPYYRGSVL
jgi:UDP-N-acetylglucosamine:LPS N-acetylglucosamine transferase